MPPVPGWTRGRFADFSACEGRNALLLVSVAGVGGVGISGTAPTTAMARPSVAIAGPIAPSPWPQLVGCRVARAAAKPNFTLTRQVGIVQGKEKVGF